VALTEKSLSYSTFDDDDDEVDDDDERADDRDDPGRSDQDPEDGDIGGDVPADALPCPFCRKLVYERADICPHCGNFISFDAESAYPRKLWFIVGVVLALGVVIMAYVLYVVFIVRRARP
jgi:hypothetical protein